MRTVGSLTALAGAVTLLVLNVEPVPTWFYVLAWYPTLVLLERLARRAGRTSPSALLSAWAWSAPIWLFFEAANFRLENWYYVFLPRHPVERWAGLLLSFATVVPAILLAERALDAWGVGARWRSRPHPVGPGALHLATALGVFQLALALAWPGIFFPLLWGGMLLVCEPLVYRRRPECSLFADLARGDWGRVGRLLAGGAGIGLLWESYNYWARGKWIYTVPWLEHLKLFEMPLLGFVGFPFFALEAWAMYHALCALGVGVPLAVPSALTRRRTLAAGLVAAGLSVLVLRGMEHGTISSVVPRLDEIPGISRDDVAALREAGLTSPFQLAWAEPAELGAGPAGLPLARADALVGFARLTVLRGIGATHARWLDAVGIRDVCTLARRDPASVWRSLQPLTRLTEPRPTPAEVRVWQRAAARACPGA